MLNVKLTADATGVALEVTTYPNVKHYNLSLNSVPDQTTSSLASFFSGVFLSSICISDKIPL